VAILGALSTSGPAAARGDGDEAHEFYFTRGIYSDTGDDDWGGRWAVDYPKADLQFLIALRRLSTVHAFDSDNALELDNPKLRKHPFLYILEVGSMSLSDSEVTALRGYLQAGGFMVVDDFWGTWAWQNFEEQMKRVLPDREIVELPMEHPVFHAFYDVTEILQVPNVYQGSMVASGGPTHEYDGYVGVGGRSQLSAQVFHLRVRNRHQLRHLRNELLRRGTKRCGSSCSSTLPTCSPEARSRSRDPVGSTSRWCWQSRR
jgi:hypothetical protein